MPNPRVKSPAAQANTGVFARLKAEAQRDLPDVAPYVIDDVDPPIAISPPNDTETQINLADLLGSDGGFQLRDARRILELICGDAFPEVWELFRKEHISVMMQLISDMAVHFGSALTGEAAGLPGGSGASST